MKMIWPIYDGKKRMKKIHNEFLAACEISCGRKNTSLAAISIYHLYKNKQALRKSCFGLLLNVELIMHNL